MAAILDSNQASALSERRSDELSYSSPAPD